MEITMTHSQNSVYGTSQAGEVHTARAATRPIPAATAHQPSHPGSDRDDRAAQPAAIAKLPRATHAVANARLPCRTRTGPAAGPAPR